MSHRIHEYPALTGLRGLAALWVLLYHAWAQAGPRAMLLPLGPVELNITGVFSMGWIGVDIFFCLSAFLLTLPFVQASADDHNQPRLGHYLLRRAARILPAYYVQLALILLAVWCYEQRLAIEPAAIAAHLVLWLNLGPNPVPPLVDVWWTLPTEFAYYLLLPFLVPYLTPRRCWMLVVAAIAMTVGYRYGAFQYLLHEGAGIDRKVVLMEQLPGHLDQFVLGSATAVWIARDANAGRALRAWCARAMTIVGVTIVAVMMWQLQLSFMRYWEGHPLLFCFHTAVSFGVCSFIVGACSDRHPDLRLLSSRPMLFVGKVSYGVYLWHQVVLHWLADQHWISLATPYTLPMLLAVGGAQSLVVAWLSWSLIEAPCLRWRPSPFYRSGAQQHGMSP